MPPCFSGIVQGTAPIKTVQHNNEWLYFTVELSDSQTEGIELGASIAANGTCLTVSKIDGNTVRFDVIKESLKRTTFLNIEAGDIVNIERALKPGDENGGHNVSGHIDGVAEIIFLEHDEGNFVLRFRLQEHMRQYVFNKGFLAVHGCSLTAGNVDRTTGECTVWLIPETLRQTNLEALKVGDLVNIEVNRETQERVDTMVEHLNSLLATGDISPKQIEDLKVKLLS